jgi:hypothetical protein
VPLPVPGAAVVTPQPPAAPAAAVSGEAADGVRPEGGFNNVDGAAVSCAAVPELVLSRTGRTLADMQRMYDVAISRQVWHMCNVAGMVQCHTAAVLCVRCATWHKRCMYHTYMMYDVASSRQVGHIIIIINIIAYPFKPEHLRRCVTYAVLVWAVPYSCILVCLLHLAPGAPHCNMPSAPDRFCSCLFFDSRNMGVLPVTRQQHQTPAQMLPHVQFRLCHH